MINILVIEDNSDMRENIAEILELSGYHVVTAENGKEGVKRARIENPDLIICDIMMPELDGYGVLHILSRDVNTSLIPFIFLTAKSDTADFRKGMNLGADDYLTKPFDEIALLDAIESRLKKSSALQKDFTIDQEGIGTFIDTARGSVALEQLSTERKLKKLKKKNYFYQQEDPANNLFFLNSGKVKLYKLNQEGKELITGLINPGEFFGFTALIKEVAHEESAVVLEEATASIIPKQDFLQLLYSNREVSAKFIQLLAKNVKEQEQKLLNMAYNTVRKRVADALIFLHDKNSPKAATSSVSIQVSRDDLASMVGTATETVIRTLSEFRQDGLLVIEKGQIFIHDLAGLRSVQY